MEFRLVFLPYCLLRHFSGGYIVLNRFYKPLGFGTSEHLIYESYPIEAKFLRMTKKTAIKLSARGYDDLAGIFLYDDSCPPTSSVAAMKQYLEKLALLAKLQIEDNRDVKHFVYSEKDVIKNATRYLDIKKEIDYGF